MNLSKIKANANLRLKALAAKADDTPEDVKELAINALKKFGLAEQDWDALVNVSKEMSRKPTALQVAEWIVGKSIGDSKSGQADKLCEDSFKIKLQYSEERYRRFLNGPMGKRQKFNKGPGSHFQAEQPDSIEECFTDRAGNPRKLTKFDKLFFLGFAPKSSKFYAKNGINNAEELFELLEKFNVEFPPQFYKSVLWY